MMTCRAVVDLLCDLVAGELSPDQRQHVEAHLWDCAACAAYTKTYGLPIRWAGQLTTVLLPPAVAQRLQAAWDAMRRTPARTGKISTKEDSSMQLPLQIAFHNLPPAEALEAVIRENAAKLDEFYNHIMSCRVVVDVPHQHHRDGNLYQVRIDLTVPGGEIMVNREPSLHEANKDFRQAVRDAFDAARRQLEDFARRQRGAVKHHEPVVHAKVSKLFPQEGYGFLVTADGREIYFHQDAVLDGGFDRLHIGAEVAFVEEAGREGPQASTVRLVGRHHHER
jgi:cold shock CspA family protein/ribosome-associated translation inhibitor RaiA